MKNKKIIFILSLALIIVPILWASTYFAKGDNYTSYYSGDSIFYYNKTVIASVNSGRAEIFEFSNNSLNKVSEISALEGESDFTDLELIKEDARLYLYLINGRYLYKYDITRTNKPALINKVKDNAWDWFLGLEELDNRLITLGRNNIKFWNENMQIIEAIPKVENEYSYNISFNKDRGYIFSLEGDRVLVYDRYNNNELIAERRMDFDNNHFRKSYFDKKFGLFVVDDNSVVKYLVDEGLNKLVKQNAFKHISEHGYDVVGSEDSNYVYFSDGVGVVKLNKFSLRPVDWIFIDKIGERKGWAQGMNIVKDNQGREMVVVYNLNNIVVLDSNMEVVDYYNSEKSSQKPKQQLYLNLSENVVDAGDTVRLSGGGFGANETLNIKYLNKKLEVSTDEDGYFYKTLEIPSVLPTYTSIKVNGESSGINYSISLTIK